MSKFHSTITRRDFMKTLGLAGAGLGVASAGASTPTFHDLDEVMSSSNAVLKHQWFVKERDHLDPTIEIDWSMVKRFDDRNEYKREDEGWHKAQRRAKMEKHLKSNTPGLTLRDMALVKGNVFMPPFPPYNLARWAGPPPDMLKENAAGFGLPPWQGTPEDNLLMMRAAARFYGANEVACVELDEKTKKLIFAHRCRKDIVFEDVDVPYEDDTKRVIPNKCKYVLLWDIVMDMDLLKRGPAVPETSSHLSHASIFQSYDRVASVQPHIQKFIQTLGYQACGYGFDGTAPAGSFAWLGGIGENGRTSFTISPKYGSMIRTIVQTFTDLPLAATKPIDAGIHRFCHSCRRCADICPSNSLTQDDPSWDVTGSWNSPGYTAFRVDYSGCGDWNTGGGDRLANGEGNGLAADCGFCQGICVFSKEPDATIHEVVKATAATTGIFNGFFTNMDELFGYPDKDMEAWWYQDRPLFGVNSKL